MTSKGQVTVPATLRREWGLCAGDRVRFVRKGKQVVIEPVVEPPIDSLFGIVKAPRRRGVADVDAALSHGFAKRKERSVK
ncbi:MAG: AbrB/MazE/SpoVT family DNA-binding domain-containing protein [Rudaea sp.]|uniref:AbrB/MazE/SpoVT family DNA-binding domain-containing protein n=1 Tax=Rudaea sp. TaxID=2136325 RepID=UPI0039E69066